MEHCRASVWSKELWSRDYQCQRKVSCERVVDGVTYGFCKQHDPIAVKARDEKRDIEMRKRWAEDDRKWEINKLLPECRAALEQIAAGHNDPRTLAVEILAKFPDATLKAGSLS